MFLVHPTIPSEQMEGYADVVGVYPGPRQVDTEKTRFSPYDQSHRCRIVSMSSSRLEVRLPDRLSERLELLASSEGLTKTDVFRRALALYLLVKEREEGGSTLQFVKDDQRETLVSI